MEKITINNFAGIKSIDFEFNSINILIGPQGSGKSVTVKLLYYFKVFFRDIVKSIELGENKRQLDQKQKEKFQTFFPKESWPKTDFKIIYTIENTIIRLEKNKGKLILKYSDNLIRVIAKAKKIYSEENKKISNDPKRNTFSVRIQLQQKIENVFREEISPISINSQFFIPAGRSFFANIQKSIFSFLSDNKTLDPFLIEFGSDYENLKQFYLREGSENDKQFNELVSEILDSEYLREKERDFLVHDDGRKVNLANASSGQQETLPLIVILKALNFIRFLGSGGITIYIEEPEAHLFPNAQKAVVRLLARTFNNENRQFQIIVTTHSPYILSSFNNLLQAGRLVVLKPNDGKRVSKIVVRKEQLEPKYVVAYSLNKGEKRDLIEKETGLISQTILDSVSNEIAIDFGNLLDVEFQDEL